MAAGYACQWGDDNHGATILTTWLDNGATIPLCPEHFSPAMINIIAVDLGVDPTRFYDGVKRLLDREAKRAADEAGKDTDGDGSPDGASGDGESTQDLGGMSDAEFYDRTADAAEFTPGPVTSRDVLLASLAGDLADSLPVDDDA